MSKSRSRNSLLSSQPKISHNVSNKDELSTMKYQLNKPNGPVYPLDPHSLDDNDSSEPQELTYPDFYPWKDPSQLDEAGRKAEHDMLTNSLYLNKGLFEAPQVSNEYYTARNLIQATLFSTGENCMEVLKELSQHLASVFKTRNEVINKIRFESNNFKLPAKVTLTSSKRDAWLKDLADPNIPLSVISHRIPHGIKNKVLVEVLTSRKVPLPRALWFTKCVLYGGSIAIRKKILMKTGHFSNDSNLVDGYEQQWIQEWTQQVMDYFFKFSREFVGVSSLEKKHEVLLKLNYLLRYIETLYIECLVDKNIVLTSIIRFFKEGLVLDSQNVMQLILKSKSESQDDEYNNNNIRQLDLNYGQRLTGLLLVKVFWKNITQSDYICKELCEALLLNYYFINKAPVFNPKQPKYQNTKVDQLLSSKLKDSLLLQMVDSIKYLFKLNSNCFIIPNYWILICGTLYDILFTNSSSTSKPEHEDTQKQFQLILHRNESLMLATRHTKAANKEEFSHKRANSFQASLTPAFTVENILSPEQQQQQSVELDSLESELFISRSPDDILKIIDYLDKLKFNDELTKLLRPLFKKSNNAHWKMNLYVSVLWCISKYRHPGKSNENILIFCAFLRHKVINACNPKHLTKIKNSIESSILDIVFDTVQSQTSQINLNRLHVLINELYQLQVITISAYLRKLIASGIFNLEVVSESDMSSSYLQNHISILENLPVLNNKQCDNILKKWGRNQIDFNKKFEQGKSILTSIVIEKLKNNNLDHLDLSFFQEYEVGIKYLLVNWLTKEIKSLFNNSSKLIHIRLLTITLLYNLYAESDNLAVFFKVVVKNILKNDGKVIIIDMDSLYLISQLMIRHFKMIKEISVNDIGSVGFEIFKLIMINYKDLVTREPDYYNFKSIWNFIDKSFERISTIESTINSKIQKHNTAPQFIYSKATVDSPMKIDTQNHDEKAFDLYSIDDFSAELNEFLGRDYNYMKQSELNESMMFLKLPDSLDTSETGSKKLIVFLIDYYMKASHNLTINEENTLIRVLINTRNLLQKDNSFAFVECFSYFVQKQLDKFASNPDRQSFVLLLKRLICNEVIDLYLVVHLISSVMSNGDTENNNSLFYDLIIGEKHEEQQSLTYTQILQLEIQRNNFHSKFADHTLEIISRELVSTSFSILQKDNIMFYNPRVNELLQKWIFTKSRFFMEHASTYFDKEQIISIVNIVSNTGITSSELLLQVAHEINEFNLPQYQILSRLVVSNDSAGGSEESQYNKINDFLHKFIPKLHFQFSQDNSFFGEFFNMFPLNTKAPLLQCFCDILFTSTVFDVDSVSCDFQGHDILPLFSDFFKKFSVSSIEFIQINGSFFDKLSKYLKSLLNIVERLKESSLSVNRALSILIRILIIHKESIANYILSNDSDYEFLVNLKSLYLTTYMCDNTERLEILLYDLLLIFKNLFSKECNMDDTKNRQQEKPYNTNIPTMAKNNDRLAAEFTICEDLVDYQTSKFEKFATIFDLPQIDNNNILMRYLDETAVKSSISLDERELSNGGDYLLLTSSKISLVQSSKDLFLSSETFNLLGDKNLTLQSNFKIKSFEILENTDKELNNGRLNLLLFDAYTTKQNPP